jgi:trehalose 6-phosphate synthase
LKRRRGAGGVAIALGCVTESRPVTWIAGAASSADRFIASAGAGDGLDERRRLRLVAPAPEAYHLFYGTFCNPLLWFLQHGLWDRLRRPNIEEEIVRAWEEGYLPVNQAFAEAVVDELQQGDGEAWVQLHDYHLYAAPMLIRNVCPRAALQHFIHVPWPDARAWERLPDQIVTSICRSLLTNDSVVFQTQASVANFLRTCETFLPDARVFSGLGLVEQRDRGTRVWANPISVDAEELRQRLESPDAAAYRSKLTGAPQLRTIVRVDRLDPAKNVIGGFEAFRVLLEKYPQWQGRVRFLACLVPSRTGIAEYAAYEREVFALVEAINGRFGTGAWQPITVLHEHNRLQALVALSLYDVLLVNSLADGMNLVSKEGPVVNERDGVLVLSTSAGSYDELREGALAVFPDDIEGTADALAQALALPPAERRSRAEQVRRAVLDHQLSDWLRLLLDDFHAMEEEAQPALASVG